MDYTKIIVSVITVLVALADAFLIPWLKTKIDANKLNRLLSYVKIAVEAAEQIFGDIEGEKKKEYVLNYLQQKGIKFDTATIDNVIESAVIEMRNELLKDYYE